MFINASECWTSHETDDGRSYYLSKDGLFRIYFSKDNEDQLEINNSRLYISRLYIKPFDKNCFFDYDASLYFEYNKKYVTFEEKYVT